MQYVPVKYKRHLDRRPAYGSVITTCCICGTEYAVPPQVYRTIETPVVCDCPECVKTWGRIRRNRHDDLEYLD